MKVSALSPLGCAVLAPIVADWAWSIASNSLWLDCRVNVKKSLFTSLPLLVEKASKLRKNQIILSDEKLNKSLTRKTVISDKIEDQITMYLSETIISCIMALSISTPGLDPYATGCLLKTLRLCQISQCDKNDIIKNMDIKAEANNVMNKEINESGKSNFKEEKITDCHSNDDGIQSDKKNENDIFILNDDKRIKECSMDLSNSLSRMFPSADDSPETIPTESKKIEEKEEKDKILLTQLKEALQMISLKYCRKEHSINNYMSPLVSNIAPIVQNNNLSFTNYYNNSNRDVHSDTDTDSHSSDSDSENQIKNINEKEIKSSENKKKNIFDDAFQETSIFKFFNDVENENENENENLSFEISETKYDKYVNNSDDNNDKNDNDDKDNNNNNNNSDDDDNNKNDEDNNEDNDDEDDDDFSDWDDDEVEIEVKTSRITRRSSFCLFDDLTVMEDEMEKLLVLLL